AFHVAGVQTCALPILHITATIDPSTPRGEELSLALQRNEPVDALVGLDVVRQRWNDDHTHRTVEEIYLHDIALVIDGWDPASGHDRKSVGSAKRRHTS